MSTQNNELVNIIRLIRSKNIGNITFIKLIDIFGTATNAVQSIPQIANNIRHKIQLYPQSEAEKEVDLANKNNIEIIPYTSPFYPPLLKKTEDYPPVLFIKGHKHLLKKSSMAIVGARNASLHGQKQATQLATELGEKGLLIVSGMAKGIDSAAHMGSLHKGSLAVLGSGVDIIYPKENTKLYHSLCEQGAVISEFPIGSKPIPTNFHKRNRIISGIARGVLVVEASLNSGSLITAKFALEQGKDVFAMPGSPNDSRYNGTNKLIKDGAILTENIFDITNNLSNFNTLRLKETTISTEYSPPKTVALMDSELTNARSFVKNALSYSPINVDLLIRESEFNYSQIATVLLELELVGKLERFPNNKVALA